MKKNCPFDKLDIRRYSMHRTNYECARAAGMSESTFTRKMKGKIPFTLDEVYGLMSLLEIPAYDMTTFFPNREENPNKVNLI